MRAHRHHLLLILLLVFVLSMAGCDQKPTARTEPAQPDTTPGDVQPTPEYLGLNVAHGDTVVVKFTVYLPKYLYFNGPKPVRILVPGNTPFTFEKNEYFMKRPVFPMRISFSVPREVPAGLQKIPLGLKLMYCNKADDICIIKNDFIPIELMVHAKKAPIPRTQVIEKTYELK